MRQTIMKPQVTYDTEIRIDGVPALIQAGTLHYFRLPHPDLWAPVLRRMRTGGLNAVVIPFPWAYHSPAAGLYDFTGLRDIRRLLDEVEAAGLWLIPDAGPWVEADLNAGGMPHWFIHTPGVRPDCSGDVPPGPSFAFLRHVREWWERLFPFFVARPNLLLLALNPGSCADGQGLPRYLRALTELAHELGAPALVAAPVQHLSVDEKSPAILPLQQLPGDVLPDPHNETEGLHILEIAPPFTWDSESRERLLRRLGAEHPRLPISRTLGQGATGYGLAPVHAGLNWGYWGMADACAASGVGAPLGEGAALTPAYFQARRIVLTAETLGAALTEAQPTTTIYASDGRVLRATRAGEIAALAFLDTAGLPATETRLSLACGDTVLTTAPIVLEAETTRILPLHWRIPGGYVLTTTMEPLLMMTVAGRHLLILVNENGGDLLLSDDFRPRHARGPVRTQRTDAGLAVRFEAARWVSLLLDGPEGVVQCLALEPRLAARVWPLDDTWRTTPAYPAVWNPAPEAPARGLVIGPEWVQPQPDGSYTCLVGEKGTGYRWGPWRGSDPHTWLAPLVWPAAPAVKLPPLVWEARPGAPEITPDYEDGLWAHAAPGAEPPGIGPDGFLWYRGHFEGTAGQLTLYCDQAGDVFLNGILLAALNTPPGATPGAPKTLPLPQHLLREHNVLAILVENLGRQHDWEATTHPRGLTACTLDSGAPIHWRARWGLSGERTVQGCAGYADRALLPDDGDPHITWHRAVFSLSLPDDVEVPLFLFLDQTQGRAYVFLNGQLIGRYADTRAPQHRFWLPEGLLRRKGENELLIAQWTRGAHPGIGAAHLEHGVILQSATRNS